MTPFPGIRLGAIVPEMILLGTAVAGLIWSMVLPRRRQWRIAALAGAGVTASLVASLVALADPQGLVFNGVFAADTTTGLARIVILAGTVGVIAMSVEHTRGHEREGEYYVLMVLSSLGAIGLSAAGDIMLVVAAYLVSSIPLYMLAAFRKDTAGTEAAMKVYLMAAFFSVLMLVGLIWLFGLSGTTLHAQIAARLTPELRPALVVAVVLSFGGLLFKIAAVPGHFWLPDAADGVPAPVAAYLSTIPKIGGIVAAGRLLASAFPVDLLDWPVLVAVVAAATMTLGNLAALWQRSPRRLLGYSAVAQAGYLLMAVAALPDSDLAVPGLLYYLGAYTAMNLGAWAVVAELPDHDDVQDYQGLARQHPGLALSLVIVLLSLAGIPPLGGFVGKLVVFAAAWDAGLGWLVVIAAGNVVASLFFYLRWIAPLYAGVPATHGERLLTGSWAKTTAYVAAAATVAIGVGARILIDAAADASLRL
jgi:NADH-quinone oxidoreductase subunit N